MVMLAIMVLTLGSCSKNPIQKEVDEINRQLPQELADGITATKVEYDESKDAITYYIDIDASMYESLDNAASKEVMKQAMTEELAKDPDIMALNVKKFIYIYRNEDSGESFTATVNKADLGGPSYRAAETSGDESVQAQIDALQSQLPMQTGEGVEWTAASYDPSTGQVTFVYNISDDIYNAIQADSQAAQMYEDEIVNGFRNTPGLKDLNVKSYSLQFNSAGGKNFGFTKTWSDIFE